MAAPPIVTTGANAEQRAARADRQGWYLLLAWSFLLAVQLPLLGTGERRGLNLALSDLVLVVAVVVAFRLLRVRAGLWSGWHAALPVVMAGSALLGGAVTRYSVGNKIVGMVVLLASYALVTSFATSWERIRLVLRAFVIGVVAVTAVTGAARLIDVQPPLTRCHSDTCLRLTGYFHDANLFGAMVVVALAVHLATIRTPTRLLARGVPGIAALFVLGGGLLMSLSRSSWAAMAAVVAGLLVLRRGAASRVAVIAGVGLVGAVAFVIGDQSDRLLRTATRSHSIDSRLSIVDDAMSSISENPAFGIGLGNFVERHDAIVHNTPLWVAAEMGAVGLVVFGGLMIWVGRMLVHLYFRTTGPRRDLVVALGLAHAALLTFSLAVEAFYQRHWWMVMGLIAAASALPDAESLPE